jgi:hypothetical protein
VPYLAFGDRQMAQYSSSLPTNTPSATDVNDALHICSGSAVKWPQGDPCSLRVIGHVLQGFALVCKSPIPKRLSLLGVAECCTVLRSRWYQSGINLPQKLLAGYPYCTQRLTPLRSFEFLLLSGNYPLPTCALQLFVVRLWRL